MSRTAALRLGISTAGLLLAAILFWVFPLGGWMGVALSVLAFLGFSALASHVFTRNASPEERVADLRERKETGHL
ncbi:MAG: hypothetical protein KDJ73_09580 [Notoacmeibacter sp.]|nr:hypothetical protein [Notoacmeibacter sp.]